MLIWFGTITLSIILSQAARIKDKVNSIPGVDPADMGTTWYSGYY